MNADDFAAKGERYRKAFSLLDLHCEVPPSLEVFDHELQERQFHDPGLSPEGLANRLATSYHRPNRGLGQGMP